MKATIFIKKLNNTELGKTGIHETYVLIPTGVDVSDIFAQSPSFFDKKTKQAVPNIRYTSGRETRIVGLGPYYRDRNANAGDEILFEKIEDRSSSKYFIDFKRFDSIIFQKNGNNGFEILNMDRFSTLSSSNGAFSSNVFYDEKEISLEVTFLKDAKKRVDSPNVTSFYEIKVDGRSLHSDYGNNSFIELDLNQGELKEFKAWNKYKIEW